MSDEKDVEDEDRDSLPDDDEDDRESDAPSEPKPPVKKASPARAPKAAASAPGVPSSRVALFVVLALGVGLGAGWYGQVQQAKAAASKADAAAPVGSSAGESGPCGAFQTKICASTGKQSAACMQAKDAAQLLTPSTCSAGLEAMPATLTRIKAARASCEKLVSKLCADLPPGSDTCTMVKDRTPSFPAQRCDEMLGHYDEVVAQLKQIDQQGGMHLGGPGGPHGAAPGPVSPPPPASPAP